MKCYDDIEQFELRIIGKQRTGFLSTLSNLFPTEYQEYRSSGPPKTIRLTSQ